MSGEKERRTRQDKSNTKPTYERQLKRCSVCGKRIKRMAEHLKKIHKLNRNSPLKAADLRFARNRESK